VIRPILTCKVREKARNTKLNVLRRAAPWAAGTAAATGVAGVLPEGKENDENDKRRREAAEGLKDWEEERKDPSVWKALENAGNQMAGAPAYDKRSRPEYQAGQLGGRYLSGYVGDIVRMIRDNPLNAGVAGSAMGGIGGLIWNLLTGSQNSALGDALKGALIGGGGLMGLHGLGAMANGVPNFGFGKYDPKGAEIGDRVENWFKDPRDFFESHPSGGWTKKSSFKKTLKKKAATGHWGSGTANKGPFQLTLSNRYRSGYPPRLQAALAGEVGRLSSHQASLLQRLLAGATGAGAVYLIAKFLFNMGSRSTVVATILGGIMGNKNQTLTGMFR
jgi:hypothetical protein